MTEFENWIVSQGLHGATLAELLDGVAIRLCSDGIPLARAYLALPTVNPNIRVLNHTWRPGVRTIVEGISHGQEQESFKVSPFNYMLQEGFSTYRWRLEGPDSDAFPVLTQMKAQGATDYLARLVSFRNTDAPALRGIAFSFTTDRKGGFADDEIARIDTVLPLTALAAYRIALLDLTIGVLDTYVGLSAGRRVLNGEIRRGSGEMLEAAILFADLRGFTALADRSPNEGDLIARLDEHLEAMAVPVTKRGGEVLKFMGDGLLAAFPKTDERSRQEACAAAVDAAVEAISNNRGVNDRHRGGKALDVDIALHYGGVFYGNIGGAGRLDFTVVGPAVNEVSRMEALCASIDCDIVMSSGVARSCGRPTRSLGRRQLRGVSEERELFTLADPG